MRTSSIQPYLLLIFVFIILFSLPRKVTDSIRAKVVATAAPGWERIQSVSQWFEHHKEQLALMRDQTPYQALKETVDRLQIHNQMLANEVAQLRQLNGKKKTLSQKAIAAQVIFRSPALWSSSLWINCGKEQQEHLQKECPVVVGNHLIGVIDYVGKRQSRVRLITDSSLIPSVRAVREVDGESHLLAKGEIQGSSHPLWRTQRSLLKGIGFNYDFADEAGPARDLRTGVSLDPTNPLPKRPIIAVNDLLVTTGLDGIFPGGLKVARVTAIKNLKEGDTYYELEAHPTAPDLDTLSTVYVIPSLGFDQEEASSLRF